MSDAETEKRAKEAIIQVKLLLSGLKQQLGDELSIISYKEGVAKKIGQEISAGFTVVELNIQILTELKLFVQSQIIEVNKEFSELEIIRQDINVTESFSRQKLASFLRAYTDLSKSAQASKSDLAKLGAKFKQIGEIIKSPKLEESKSLQSRRDNLWSEIQVLQKSIKSDIDFGGDIDRYEVFLGQVKKSLEKQLEEIANLIINWQNARKHTPSALANISRTKETEKDYILLERNYYRLLAVINSEKEAEQRLEERLPALAAKYEEVKSAVELE